MKNFFNRAMTFTSEAFQVLVAVVFLLGFVINLIKLFAHTGVFGLLEVLRVIGVFFYPLGALMGFVH